MRLRQPLPSPLPGLVIYETRSGSRCRECSISTTKRYESDQRQPHADEHQLAVAYLARRRAYHQLAERVAGRHTCALGYRLRHKELFNHANGEVLRMS